MLENYFPILLFLVGRHRRGALLLGVGCSARAGPDREKLSPYECGFEAFEDARMKFDVRYYLVAILFILFDLEIAFLFPWAVVLQDIGWFGFWSMMVFLAHPRRRLHLRVEEGRAGMGVTGRAMGIEGVLQRRLRHHPASTT